MKHQTRLVVAICLALVLTASATWALATNSLHRSAQGSSSSTNSAILTFSGIAVPNVGEICSNFSGASFVCGNLTPNYSSPLPRAGELVTMIIHPITNDVITNIIIVIFVNNVPTALYTEIAAGNTSTRIVSANVSVAAADLVKIVTEGFKTPNNDERLQYTGSVVYQYP